MQKKSFITSVSIIAIIFIAVAILSRQKQEQPASATQTKTPIAVSVQTVADSKALRNVLSYPATVVGDQEVTVTARTSGTITAASFNLGDYVAAGRLLAKIDDTGSLKPEDGFRSSQVQQTQLAVDQAKKSYDLAKKAYDAGKEINDPSVSALKGQRDLAKMQYENAVLAAKSTVDAHLTTSPISGRIVQKHVSVGDSITIGQPIATISKTENVKLQFFVEQDRIAQFTRGMQLSVSDAAGNELAATVTSISPQADPSTKRFLIEAVPQRGSSQLASGIIVTVTAHLISETSGNTIFLPLSVVTVGQNETYIFIVQDSVVKKFPVSIVSVDGETAEVSGEFTDEMQIITQGNKLVQDKETVTITN